MNARKSYPLRTKCIETEIDGRAQETIFIGIGKHEDWLLKAAAGGHNAERRCEADQSHRNSKSEAGCC